jgi:hypothetical protein
MYKLVKMDVMWRNMVCASFITGSWTNFGPNAELFSLTKAVFNYEHANIVVPHVFAVALLSSRFIHLMVY